MCSRSFGKRVTTKEELHSALASFISRACEKLRTQNQFAREAIIFIRTDAFQQDSPQIQPLPEINGSLPQPVIADHGFSNWELHWR